MMDTEVSEMCFLNSNVVSLFSKHFYSSATKCLVIMMIMIINKELVKGFLVEMCFQMFLELGQSW